MTLDELRSLLAENDASFTEKHIQKGTQIRCKNGEFFNVYDTGTVVCGGKRTKLTSVVESHTNLEAAPVGTVPASKPVESIFIVYGHDTRTRDELELLLPRMGLHPIILANLPAEGDTIIEKLESFIGKSGKAVYAFVLVTPDDEGHKAGESGQKKYRARQNVVLELGMVLAKLGRKKVAILKKKTVEQPSDIDGLLYIPFDERIEEIKLRIVQELQAAGFEPRL
jgi:predicted nucleotide-binding protein